MSHRPYVLGYPEHGVLRQVTAEGMDDDGVAALLDGTDAILSELRDDPVRLLLDARRKSFFGLDAQRRLSQEGRQRFGRSRFERAALVSQEWASPRDLELQAFDTLEAAWLHLSGAALVWPRVSLVVGSTGAGKTSFARFLEEDSGAVRFSLDGWMRALFHTHVDSDHDFAWYMERIRRIEAVMQETGARIAATSVPLVIDAGFSSREDRNKWIHWARSCGLDVQIYFLDVPARERWRRVEARNQEPDTDSVPVTRGMFDFVEARFEAPSSDEAALVLVRG